MASIYSVIKASPPESHAQNKSKYYYVDLGVLFMFLSNLIKDLNYDLKIHYAQEFTEALYISLINV